MNNFELHEAAQLLADTESAYTLARRVVELEDMIDKLESVLPVDIDEVLEGFND